MASRWQGMGSMTPPSGSIPASREGELPPTLTHRDVRAPSLKILVRRIWVLSKP